MVVGFFFLHTLSNIHIAHYPIYLLYGNYLLDIEPSVGPASYSSGHSRRIHLKKTHSNRSVSLWSISVYPFCVKTVTDPNLNLKKYKFSQFNFYNLCRLLVLPNSTRLIMFFPFVYISCEYLATIWNFKLVNNSI